MYTKNSGYLKGLIISTDRHRPFDFHHILVDFELF